MVMNSKSLEGKVALVTGAGRGIGKAIAIGYAQAGADVGCVSRTISEIVSTAAEISSFGGKSLAIQTDVGNREAVQNLFAKVEDYFGGLDILVINAAVNYGRSSIEESDPEKWKETLDINLIGAYYSAKYSIPYLKARGAGKIILVGSGFGHRGSEGSSAYSCSKAALWMLTRILAQELQQYKISVNELIPGPVRTSMIPKKILPGEWLKEPQDVVPLALFLATQPDIGPTAQSFRLCRRQI